MSGLPSPRRHESPAPRCDGATGHGDCGVAQGAVGRGREGRVID